MGSVFIADIRRNQLIRADYFRYNPPMAKLIGQGDGVDRMEAWVYARPLPDTSYLKRLKDAWLVLTGKCDALKWEDQ